MHAALDDWMFYSKEFGYPRSHRSPFFSWEPLPQWGREAGSASSSSDLQISTEVMA
jgi:hypothetical protein